VNVCLLQEFATHCLPSAALEEDVVGNHHGGAAVQLENRPNMLQEVELLVARRRPRVWSIDDQ
jgi:hypothetical protein